MDKLFELYAGIIKLGNEGLSLQIIFDAKVLGKLVMFDFCLLGCPRLDMDVHWQKFFEKRDGICFRSNSERASKFGVGQLYSCYYAES